MEEQQNSLTYEIIKAAVAGEKWATEKIMAYYDDYMTELATVEEKQSDGSVKSYVDEDLKQEIALKLLEEIPNFPLEEAERIAGGETDWRKIKSTRHSGKRSRALRVADAQRIWSSVGFEV